MFGRAAAAARPLNRTLLRMLSGHSEERRSFDFKVFIVGDGRLFAAVLVLVANLADVEFQIGMPADLAGVLNITTHLGSVLTGCVLFTSACLSVFVYFSAFHFKAVCVCECFEYFDWR